MGTWKVPKFVKTIQPSIFWAKLTCKINVVSIFEYKSIIHLEFILVYVRRNEPMLFFFQMVSQLFQHLFLNNSFLSTHLKCHFYDILKNFVELGVVLLLLCYSSDLSILVLEKQFKRHSILPESLLLPLRNFIDHSLRSVCHASPLSSISNLPPLPHSQHV